MKVFYLNFTDLDNPRNAGLVKKQSSELGVLSQSFDVGYLELRGKVFKLIDANEEYVFELKSDRLIQFKKRQVVYGHLLKYLIRNNYDVLYLRYNLSDMFLISFLKKLKIYNIKVVIQIPTYPYLKEHNKFIIGVDQMYARKLKGLVDRIITYSDDDIIYGIKTIKINNGVDYQEISLKKPQACKTEINLLGVASLASWHGFDRVIKSLENYYNSNDWVKEVNFFIVGSGKESDVYQALIQQSPIKEILEKHVFLLGYQFGQKLDEIFDKSQIGIEVLAMHRKGLSKSSSLKSKEYLAKGIPFVTAAQMDIESTPLTEFYFQIEMSDNSFDIKEIISQYELLIDRYTEQELPLVIRNKSLEYCDIHYTLKPFINYLRSIDHE